ncbi:MAG: GxxExxY protein [Calditrichaeota bacterium]|nr:GxxExxY protein [Calditrichota bacterium]
MLELSNDNRYLYKSLSQDLIGDCIDVHKELGNGFLEKVYENALTIRLNELRIPFQQQVKYAVIYHSRYVGEFVADLVIDSKILLELKAVNRIESAHLSQLLNYLNASRLRVGYLFNFGQTKIQFQRYIR